MKTKLFFISLFLICGISSALLIKYLFFDSSKKSREEISECLSIDVLSSSDISSTSNDCTLLVNGKDISEDNYIKINYQEKTAEFPLLAILSELGTKIQKNDNNIIVLEFKEKIVKIDLSKSDFDIAIPPGGEEAVRKIINDEVIIDYSSAQPLLEFFAEAKIRVDYESSIITVNSIS